VLRAISKKHTLLFKQPSGTSRGVLSSKESWFIFLIDTENPGLVGIGECGLLKGLSCDDREDYQKKLVEVCEKVQEYPYWLSEGLIEWPSIRFGLETALKDLEGGGQKIIFDNPFTAGVEKIAINGLVWMGEYDFMKDQIQNKIDNGYKCIKLKIGAIDFEKEIQLLELICSDLSTNDIEIRVDANGAFSPEEALKKITRLAQFDVHSIEQPIKQGQWGLMGDLCKKTSLPIALDEELIGVHSYEDKRALIQQIQPQYLIFKPSLLGGFLATQQWIDLAKEYQIDWWFTSALESNIGLNAISQWASTFEKRMYQGLGTGMLYTNNFDSPLDIQKGEMSYNPKLDWNLSLLFKDVEEEFLPHPHNYNI